MEKLPIGTCDAMIGLGCCLINIEVNLRAFTLNFSRISDSPQSKKVQAFITSYMEQSFRLIDAYTGSITPYGGTQLDWSIPYQPNCKRAMEDKDSYACVSNNSKCQDSPISGYLCYCGEDEGNAYEDGGCYNPPATAYDSIQPRTDCPTSCNNVSTPFPFGTELGCFAKPHLYLKCIPTAALPVLHLTNRMLVTDISIDDSVLQVQETSEPDDFMSGSDRPPYALSGEGERGMVKWAIDNMTCEHAMNKSDYRCFSTHSGCIYIVNARGQPGLLGASRSRFDFHPLDPVTAHGFDCLFALQPFVLSSPA